MPHVEAVSPPQSSRIVPVQSQTCSDDVVEAFLDSVLSANLSQEGLDAAYALTDYLIKNAQLRGLTKYGVLERFKQAAHDKKNVSKREGSVFAIGALIERYLQFHKLSEVVFLVQYPDVVPNILDSLADKVASVREGSQYALNVLFANLQPEALAVGLLELLIQYLSRKNSKWQGILGAHQILIKMAKQTEQGAGSCEIEKEILRLAMGNRLADLIPLVETQMHELKAEVSKKAIKTMNAMTLLIQNDDLTPRIPLLLKAMTQPCPETLQKAIHALSQTTFVAVVTSPVLAVVTPLLERSLNSLYTSQEVLRQTVVVIENLTKLVHNPEEARAFLPKLLRGVRSAIESASLPEVREIAVRTLRVMEKAMGIPREKKENQLSHMTDQEAVRAMIEKSMKSHGAVIEPNMEGLEDSTVIYLSRILAENIHQRRIERIESNIQLYLEPLIGATVASKVGQELHAFYRDRDAQIHGAPEPEDDEGETEIVNATFSLGYGARLLLSHTNLRLLKGHRYGLCGQNGAGKSTLLRSIAEGKLEGFPTPDQLKTCFVEHNQGEDADYRILEFISRDPRFSSEPRDRISSVLEEFGFTAGPNGRQSEKVGSLSGGWKMKLALARAMLMRADVLLLDEPTNHLDVTNIKWLQDYLQTHTDVTSLIVSHDSGFLDAVCTDIYHYENKKLVRYKGNLAAFVKLKPETRSYYTLSANNVQFKFPTPGILTGVKSNTRAVLRITNCTYTYPKASKPSLINVSCALSLSSRVAIIGPNGAGKSTMIKILTGELIPNEGKMEKHPNLRIGYIKQHALEHVEMHLEKTPNQYIQWRYANGHDREVAVKQTRILTAEDAIQMEKLVDLHDGHGPRQIEGLMGRQKWKKSFQYEVKWVRWLPKFNTMVSRETLLELGFQKLVQEFDDHESSREGLEYRQLEPKVIAQHFEDVGLDPDIANHTPISGLSGGQKVKVVLAGAMWSNPHLLVLDEPTNFLDRDSLGGLAVAIRDFKGGVVMISHNHEFVGALCPEQWHFEAGRVTHKGFSELNNDKWDDGGKAGGGVNGTGGIGSRGSSGAPSRVGTPGPGGGVRSGSTSAAVSTANSETESPVGDLQFKARKKKKPTRAQLKEREVRRRLRHIQWLNSPKGTPRPPDTDDEE